MKFNIGDKVTLRTVGGDRLGEIVKIHRFDEMQKEYVYYVSFGAYGKNKLYESKLVAWVEKAKFQELIREIEQLERALEESESFSPGDPVQIKNGGKRGKVKWFDSGNYEVEFEIDGEITSQRFDGGEMQLAVGPNEMVWLRRDLDRAQDKLKITKEEVSKLERMLNESIEYGRETYKRMQELEQRLEKYEPKPEPVKTFEVGDLVKIIAHHNKGRIGVVTEVIANDAKCGTSYRVFIDENTQHIHWEGSELDYA